MLGWILNKKLKICIEKVYPLADAAQAQSDLESRKTMGKLLLKVVLHDSRGANGE